VRNGKHLHGLPTQAFRRARIWLHAAAALLLLATLSATAQGPAVYDAAQVKAAFLYHFGTYVRWPATGENADPLTIAVLGDDEVAEHLAQFLPGRRIEERPVRARTIARIEELGEDEILFVGRANNARLTQTLSAIGQRPVLVVTDAVDGLERGAMVNFQLVDSRVRFEISLPRAQEAGLELSSRLLAAALRVEPE
jgi:hypothetical protein